MTAAIMPLILCKKCRGDLVLANGSECDRCVDADGLPTGVDPVSRCGCVFVEVASEGELAEA